MGTAQPSTQLGELVRCPGSAFLRTILRKGIALTTLRAGRQYRATAWNSRGSGRVLCHPAGLTGSVCLATGRDAVFVRFFLNGRHVPHHGFRVGCSVPG